MTSNDFWINACRAGGTSCVLRIAFEKNACKKVNTELTENFTRFAPVIDIGASGIQLQME